MQRFLKRITADTLALAIFSALTGAFGLLFERYVASLSLVQMAGIRLGYNILKYLFAEFCAQIADNLRTRLMGNSKHQFRRALADGLALSGYQLPLYIGCALVAQAETRQMAEMVAFYLANNMAFGWLYGLALNWVRTRFSVRPTDSL